MNYQAEILLKLFLAVLFGGIIGLERESHHRWAGFRTHILVAMGSCLIMITSIEIGQMYAATMADPGRIAAQVVSGIGFLGAGTILHSSSRIRGLTTAATLWAMAGIGLAVGAGLYFPAASATIFAFIILHYFRKLEARVLPTKFANRWTIELQLPFGAASTTMLFQILVEYGLQINHVHMETLKDFTNVNLEVESLASFDRAQFIETLQQRLKVCSTDIKEC